MATARLPDGPSLRRRLLVWAVAAAVAVAFADSSIERMEEKVAWVREGARQAGRDPDAIELNTMATRIIVGPRVGMCSAPSIVQRRP